MYKIGIIPAAGIAHRFGGIPKELLPLPDGRTLLEHAVDRLDFCDRIVVVSNMRKEAMHRLLLPEDVDIVKQKGFEMFGAMKTAYNQFDGDAYYMTMPDTWCDPDAFKPVRCGNFDFGMGLFLTREPHRFGVLVDGQVINKPKNIKHASMAWGVLCWRKYICDIWNDSGVTDYTAAINHALSITDCKLWQMLTYLDCADIDAYMDALDQLDGKL